MGRRSSLDGSSSNNTSGTKGNNPFTDDPELKNLLTTDLLSRLDNRVEFNGWRFSFLTKFDKFLDAEGSEKAEDAYVDFAEVVAHLVRVVHQMEGLIEQGAISSQTADITVKGRQCLEEIKAQCIAACDALAELLPGSATSRGDMDSSKKYAYTNYHMGAILIGDGFSLYGYLSTCDVILMQRKESMLDNVADRQILNEIDNYHRKLQVFCDVMRDLGLYGAMMKAREIAERDGDDESDLESILDVISEHSRAMSSGIITSISESDSEDDFKGDSEEEEAIPPPPAPFSGPTPTASPPPAPAQAREASAPRAMHKHTPIKVKKGKKKEVDEPDLPKTTKPTQKKIFPDIGRRGSMPAPPSRGRTPPTLSKQEPKAISTAPAPRRNTMPAAPCRALRLAALPASEVEEEEDLQLSMILYKPPPKSNVPILDKIMEEADKENIPGLSPRMSNPYSWVAPRKEKQKRKPKLQKRNIAASSRRAPSLPMDARAAIGRQLSIAEAREEVMPKIVVPKRSLPPAKFEPAPKTKLSERYPAQQTPQVQANRLDESEKEIPPERDPQPYSVVPPNDGQNDPRVSLKREPRPYGWVQPDDGKNEPRVSLTRESQPYGMNESEKEIARHRDPQPYGFSKPQLQEEPVPLEREPQPYGFSQTDTTEEEDNEVSEEEYESDKYASEDGDGPPINEPEEESEPAKPSRASLLFKDLKDKAAKGAAVAAKVRRTFLLCVPI